MWREQKLLCCCGTAAIAALDKGVCWRQRDRFPGVLPGITRYCSLCFIVLCSCIEL